MSEFYIRFSSLYMSQEWFIGLSGAKRFGGVLVMAVYLRLSLGRSEERLVPRLNAWSLKGTLGISKRAEAFDRLLSRIWLNHP